VSGPGNSTRHIELDIRGTGIYYGTADDLSILPENDPAVVATFARWLGFDRDLDRWFTLEPAPRGPGEEAPKALFPTPTTVRRALAAYCDVNGPPSKQLISYLACYAQASAEVSRALVCVCGYAGTGCVRVAGACVPLDVPLFPPHAAPMNGCPLLGGAGARLRACVGCRRSSCST
jgi:hypothetical protein